MARTLDMPIKFLGSNFRIPKSLLKFKEVIELVANYDETSDPSLRVFPWKDVNGEAFN